jgi:hypothetical protein
MRLVSRITFLQVKHWGLSWFPLEAWIAFSRSSRTYSSSETLPESEFWFSSSVISSDDEESLSPVFLATPRKPLHLAVPQ